jgi:hypothetical protein
MTTSMDENMLAEEINSASSTARLEGNDATKSDKNQAPESPQAVTQGLRESMSNLYSFAIL